MLIKIGKLGLTSSILGGGISAYRFIFMGASHTDQALADVPAFKAQIEAAYPNKTIYSVHNEGRSGDTSTQYKNAVDSILANYSQIPGVLTVCVLEIGGNDVSNTRPYSSSGSAPTILGNNIDYILSAIASKGFTSVLTDITFRNYDGTTIFSEDQGSLPYITNIIRPKISAAWKFSSGRSKVQLYDLMRNSFGNDFYRADFLDNDNIHQIAAGRAALRQLWVDTVVKKILTGDDPIEINPAIVSPKVARVSPHGFNTENWAGFMGNTVGSSLSNITDILGRNTDWAISITTAFTVGATNGDQTGSKFPPDVISRVLPAAAGSPGAFRISGLNNAKQYTIKLLASRSGITGPRMTKFTIDGVSQEIDAALNTQNLAIYTNITPVSGNIDVTVEAGSGGATFGYWNGVVIEEQT